MKKYPTLLIFCFLIVNTGFGQYTSLLKENSKWYVYHWFEASCNETYSVQGDSTVKGKVYKKFTAEPYCQWNYEKITLLREDTIAKKVYKLLYDTTETILYDFNLQPGDSVVIYPFPTQQYILYLDSITNNIQFPEVTIPENARVFYFRYDGAAYQPIWIEGVGSLAGPLASEYPWGHGALGEVLLCHYNENGIKDYNDPIWQVSDCEGEVFYRNIEQIDDNNYLILFPNPSNNSIGIKNNFNTKMSALRVIDCLGRTKLIKVDMYTSFLDLDISRLPKGTYFLQAVTGLNKVLTKRFIKN